jgi:hypothetical protein
MLMYGSLLSSEPFKVLISSDEKSPKEFFIHSSVLAAQSSSLNALVNGDMKEA